MKTLNKICQILSIVFGLGALVLFFLKFATITYGADGDVNFVGSVLAFGGSKTIAGVSAKIAKSTDILLCLLITAFGFVMSVFSFKKKGLRYSASAFSLAAAIYMLVIRLSNAWNFVDTECYAKDGSKDFIATNVKYSKNVTFIVIALFLFAAFSIAYLLIDDKLEVLASKGAKKTIFSRIGHFFRDYKSEVKKIVWPTFRDVLKNTGIVLVMCLLVGIIIWLLDWGLGSLIKIILK